MFFPFTKIESVFALFSSYVLSKPYADWAEKYRKKSQSDTHFRTVGKICFPNAVIVADRFHVIRQAFWAMEQVRKNEQNKLSRGLRRYFKRSKHLLRKPMEALSSEEQECLALMVEIAPRLAVMHSESSTVGKQRLLDWLAAVNVMDLPEFQACVTAYRNWFQEILNSMDVPCFIEGCNNKKTKVLKRVCFGMRNFRNFRNRILFCSGVPKKPRRG